MFYDIRLYQYFQDNLFVSEFSNQSFCLIISYRTLYNIWVVIHLSQIQMSHFIILDIQLSQLTIMFCVQVVVQWKYIFQLSQNFSWT